ncbi:twin-arginine translocase TatA/TatE family subunit [Halobacteriales archaeon QS_3_64_16]|nr:MAG: twin-arginine translocase TatA/TatE family subunit [Halobacteriales archaeon QS_3_64_16]
MILTTALQIGIPGGPELLIILLIAVLLFGANKLPKLARSSGQAMGEFQKGREEIDQELEKMREGPGASSDSDAESDTGATSTSAESTGPETAESTATDTETTTTETETTTETATES